ncbi:MAG: gluconate 2-dehydrogenase subunit 3 family protein [Acidobacteria bacterium]|nr:gluconate 2-dehydrogenase subunit 3 family protein [Acidobacteriota bacterium]
MFFRQIGRRALMGISAAAGIVGSAGCRKGTDQRLSATQLRLLELFCEQIIPSDDVPGALEAGSAQYIDLQLSGRLKEFAAHYPKGLAALEASSWEKYGRGFGALEFAERTALLKAVETGKVNQALWPEKSSKRFFVMARRHTIEGTFCSPRHGGNRDLAGYRLLGWVYPEPRGQNRYTDPRFRRG